MKKMLKNGFIMVGLLTFATLIAFALFYMVPNGGNSANIAIIYVLALILIARYTAGGWYGFVSSVVCVICVNYLFTYPYFKLNFTLSGYPVTFFAMLIITSMTSTMTSIMTKQAAILKQKEKELMEAEKERMRANLLRAVSHDIRTPLTSIIVASDSYMEHPDGYQSKDVYQLLSKIKEDANWMIHMVENLISVTRINTECSKVIKSMEPVEEIVQEAVLRVKKQLPKAQIAISMPSEFVMIPVDPLLIEQVIMNLLENAVVHGKSEKPVELQVKYQTKMVELHIRDYGVGIREEEIYDMMNGTMSAGRVRNEEYKGMGVGLSICKTIIDVHEGTFEAKKHKQGSEFVVTLPRE